MGQTPRLRAPLAAIAVTAVAIAVAGCSDSGTPATERVAAVTAPQRIAVPLGTSRGGEGSGGIVLIDPTGRRVATLTARRAGREDSEPAWSPDGKRVAFTRTTDGRRSCRIYVMRADGSGVRRITSGPADFSPAWSPDGRLIAYRANRLVRVVRPDGSGGRTVPTGTPADPAYPAWVPGGRIAYSWWSVLPGDQPPACRQAGSMCGWVVSSRLDGTGRRRVVRGRDAHWSPDGDAIVYTGPDGGVFTAPGAGGRGRQLGRGHLAEWSRDGARIVYARLGSTYARDSIWIMRPDGSGAHRILTGGTNPSWQP